MLLKVAVGVERPVKKMFATSDVAAVIEWLKEMAARRKSSRIVFAYEASGQGFGLYDELTDAGIECYVLAPTHLPHTSHRRKNKTDERDAQMILDEVRAQVLAGRKLPTVWVPDPQTRDDREPVRMRLALAEQRTRIKNQIRSLAKRAKLAFPAWFTSSGDWSRRSVQWLREIAAGQESPLGTGLRITLTSLVDLYEQLCQQLKKLDQAIGELARSARYATAYRKLTLLSGVGTLTAMVFLTELGDLNRFRNRRQLSSYLGLVPAAFESGERDDRKGHITRQGPSHLRHMLCQAAWSALRCCEKWKLTYERLKRGTSKRSKVAIVAVMRQLGVLMWQTARSVEVQETLERIDREKAAAQAQQKGAAPVPLAVPQPV